MSRRHESSDIAQFLFSEAINCSALTRCMELFSTSRTSEQSSEFFFVSVYRVHTVNIDNSGYR
jgi:hypothetical protein